jgi:RNA polymerase sigma factor (sigma-70 family)
MPANYFAPNYLPKKYLTPNVFCTKRLIKLLKTDTTSSRNCGRTGPAPAIQTFGPHNASILVMERSLSLLLLICLLAAPTAIPCGERTTMTNGHSNLFSPGRIIVVMDTRQTTQAPTDASLVRLAAKGDCQAYAQLYERHAGWLLTLLWRFTGGDKGKAEDVLQEAFVQAWTRLGQLREPARFGGWLRKLAINLALADRRKLQIAGTDQALAGISDPEPPWPASDVDLERSIAALPERARQVLVLFCVEGCSHDEIAHTLNIEVGTSKAQLHRARGLLKETLS